MNCLGICQQELHYYHGESCMPQIEHRNRNKKASRTGGCNHIAVFSSQVGCVEWGDNSSPHCITPCILRTEAEAAQPWSHLNST